jgi:hypothetical protein
MVSNPRSHIVREQGHQSKKQDTAMLLSEKNPQVTSSLLSESLVLPCATMTGRTAAISDFPTIDLQMARGV